MVNRACGGRGLKLCYKFEGAAPQEINTEGGSVDEACKKKRPHIYCTEIAH